MQNVLSLLDFISGPESNGNYNAYSSNANNQAVRLTDMTIREVLAWQDGYSSRGSASTAAGRYQIIKKTLGSIYQAAGLSLDDQFSEANQDRLGYALLQGRGLDDYLNGSLSIEAFGNNLAREWAGLPVVAGAGAGRSYYDGDGLNASGVTVDDTLAAIRGMGPRGTVTQASLPNLTPPSPTFQFGQSGQFQANPNYEGMYVPDADIPIQRQGPAPSFTDTAGAAWQNTTTAWGLQELQRMITGGDDRLPDASFSVTPDRIKADVASAGLSPEYIRQFGNARSEGHYQQILADAVGHQERSRTLAAAGLTGMAATMVMETLDPTGLGVDLAASLLGGGALVLGKRTSRLATIAASALSGAAGGGAYEALGARVNPYKDQSDIAAGIILGAGLGGVVGSFMKNPNAVTEAAQVQQIAQRIAQNYEGQGVPMTATPATFYESIGVDGKALKGLPDDDSFRAAWGKVRIDLHGQLARSKNPVTRALAGLVGDGVGKRDHSVNAFSATEDKAMLTEMFSTAYHRAYVPNLKQYAEDAAKQGGRRGGELETEFREQIARYIRDRDVDRNAKYHESVVKQAQREAQLYNDIRGLAQNPFSREGMQGRPVGNFASVEANPHYLPRVWDALSVTKFAGQKGGKAKLNSLIAGAIRSAQPDIQEALVQKIAKSFRKAIVDRAHGIDDAGARMIDLEDTDLLIRVLRDEGQLDKATAEDIARRFTKPKGDGGANKHSKRRMFLDEKYQEEGTSIEDLLVNDSYSLFQKYNDSVVGNIALARYRLRNPATGELIVDGITDRADFDKLIRSMKQQAKKVGQPAEELARDIKKMELVYKHLKGYPLHDLDPSMAQFIRILKGLNFGRLMGMAGFAQVPDFGNTMGSLGIKAAMQHVPAFRRVLKENGDYALRSGFADDMEMFTGIGTERLRANAFFRTDDMAGSPHSTVRGTTMDKVEGLLDKTNKGVSDASGMAGVTMAQQRMTSMAIVQKFVDHAHGAKGLSPRRLADLGLDAEMTERVLAEMRMPGNFDLHPGADGKRKIARANFDNWDDLEAKEAFRRAVWRKSRQLIQGNDLGNLPGWVSHPIAGMMTQFRVFTLGAYTKQTLKHLHFRDKEALAGAIWSSMLATAAYAAQVKVRALGRDDAEEFEQKLLSPENMTAAALGRAGWASFLPMIVDTASFNGALYSPVFGNIRSTTQSSDLIFGNPTFGLVDDLTKSVSSIVNPLKRGEISQDEIRSIPRPVIGQNTIPALLILNGLTQGKEAFAPRD